MLPYEKSVYSQNGEDGIIEFLLDYVSLDQKNFLEIGWGRGSVNCCKNLAMNHNFTGTGIDRKRQKINVENVNVIVKEITVEHIDYIISLEGNEPTVFSLDIDSYDWHLLKALLLKNFKPKIICHEYNSLLGPTLSITRSLNKDTVYDKYILYGASLQAYKKILSSEYNFITVDSAGVNAFWLRKDFNKPTNYSFYDFKSIDATVDYNNIISNDPQWVIV